MGKNERPLVYCGHGTGTSWVNEMNGQPVELKGLPILMGCSSARLNDYSFTHLRSRKSKASARSLVYTKSGCPAFLGCLWDVTDVDIDIFTIEYIELLKSKLQSTAR